MSEGSYPSVYVVDSHVSRPPIPPRLKPKPPRAGVAQTLLSLLVCMALCGIAIEGCFIYNLYQAESDSSATSSKQISGEGASGEKKPVAHLTDGLDANYENVSDRHTMLWSTSAEPLVKRMKYANGSLFIEKSGYYYIYSKVKFLEHRRFYHTIHRKTPLYEGGSICLLQSRSYSDAPEKYRVQSNSFLGGVFQLSKGDSIYVNVSDVSHVMRHRSYENTFGAYMI